MQCHDASRLLHTLLSLHGTVRRHEHMADPCWPLATEMKLLAAAVYTNYTTHIADDTGIEQSDGYAGRPASEQLWVRFGRIDHSS